jgi:8-oxo-dGTP diphosphatase
VIKEVSAGIFTENGKTLLAKRKGGSLSGYWEFPGGKRENNETIFECLEREIKEEFNVECKALRLFCESIYEYEHGAIKLMAIVAELADKNIVLSAHDEYAWVEKNKLLDYKLAPADVYVAELLLKENGVLH